MQKNRIEIAGYLAAKPTVRYLPSGTPVANARLGESYTYKDAEGKAQKHTNWHSLSFYGDLSSVAVTFEKGDNIFAEGSIEQRQFTPRKDGVQRTVQEIIVRACHLIASMRGAAAKTAEINGNGPIAEEAPISESALDVANHDHWPVG
ncbi:MAG: single-stranded DNA-binding protein [Bryobacteraceae bacterium]